MAKPKAKFVEPPIVSSAPRLTARPMSRSLRVYQKVAIVFVALSFMLLLVVLYLSISQATVHVTPNPQVVSATVPIELSENAVDDNQVRGIVMQETFTKAQSFTLPSEGGKAVEAKAGGKVTLINESNVAQPLVATTRLLSKEGVLFRIDSAVTIPANGQIETMAHADQPGSAGDIGPTQFTIPGLPASSQSVIYAVSVDSMIGGVQYIHIVTQDDLDEAAAELSTAIVEDAKTSLRAKVDTSIYDGEAFGSEIVEQKSDTAPGAETGTFNVSLVVRVTAVFYDKAAIATYAKANLVEQLPDGFDLSAVNEDGLQVTVASTDVARKTATLSVYLDGVGIISASSDVLDKSRITGRSAQEVMTLLRASDSVKDVSVTFTPFWLKRVPTLEDHIEIIIEQP